jgi:multicomponent Na+:H+ antiporter subunit F
MSAIASVPMNAPAPLTGDLITDVFLTAAAVFLLLAVAMLYRAVKGPTTQDRVLAVNVLGTNTVVVLALLGAGLGEPSLLDIALVYALLNFLMAVAISKFTVERGGVL